MQHRKLVRLNAFCGAGVNQPSWRELPEELLAIITGYVSTLRDRFSWLAALCLTSPTLRAALRSNRWIYGPPDLCALTRLISANLGTSRGQSLATCRRSVPGLLKAYQCVFRVAAAYWLLERSEQVDHALSNLAFFRGAVPRAHFPPLIDCPLS